MHVTVKQLAALIHGQVHGDEDLPVRAARPLDEAGPDDITFLENDRHVRQLKLSRARVVIIPASLTAARSTLTSAGQGSLTLIEVRDPLAAFIEVVRHLHGIPEPGVHGVDPLASIHPTAQIGRDASIHAFAVVGEGSVVGERCRLHSGAAVGRHCRLGDDVILHPHAVLYDGTILGHRVILHAGVVIGADGFGYRFQNGRHAKVPQLGWVEIGDDVEIGAGTTIDRGTFHPTRIGTGTKIDNLVQVGHNCQIGRHNLLVSQVGIGGSTTTGDYVVLAGQVGVADHVHIGDGALIGACSGVPSDVEAGERMLGVPARPEREQKRIIVSLDRLPGLCRDVRFIKQHLGLHDETDEQRKNTSGTGESPREAG